MLAVFVVACALGADAPVPGTLFVSGYNSNRVYRYDAETGASLGPLDAAGPLGGPLGIELGPDGLLYVASETTDAVLRYDPSSGDYVDAFIAPGTGGLSEPAGIVFGPDRTGDGHGDLFVSSFNGDSVLVFDGLSGAYVERFVSPGSGGLNGPDAGMAFGPDGDLYVPSFWSSRVLRYDGATGAFVETVAGPGSCGMSWPRTIVFDSDSPSMFVTCEGTDRVSRYGLGCSTLISNIGAPTGLTLDSARNLYVVSLADDAVYRYDADTGAFIDVVVHSGSGGLATPTFALLIEATPPCPADFDESGAVDVADLLTLLGDWGVCLACSSDLNDDEMVTVADLLLLLDAWGDCAG